MHQQQFFVLPFLFLSRAVRFAVVILNVFVHVHIWNTRKTTPFYMHIFFVCIRLPTLSPRYFPPFLIALVINFIAISFLFFLLLLSLHIHVLLLYFAPVILSYVVRNAVTFPFLDCPFAAAHWCSIYCIYHTYWNGAPTMKN